MPVMIEFVAQMPTDTMIFVATWTLSAFIGALMVGVLLGERWPSASVRQYAPAQLA
jgi:hypothetical protein